MEKRKNLLFREQFALLVTDVNRIIVKLLLPLLLLRNRLARKKIMKVTNRIIEAWPNAFKCVQRKKHLIREIWYPGNRLFTSPRRNRVFVRILMVSPYEVTRLVICSSSPDNNNSTLASRSQTIWGFLAKQSEQHLFFAPITITLPWLQIYEGTLNKTFVKCHVVWDSTIITLLVILTIPPNIYMRPSGVSVAEWKYTGYGKIHSLRRVHCSVLRLSRQTSENTQSPL